MCVCVSLSSVCGASVLRCVVLNSTDLNAVCFVTRLSIPIVLVVATNIGFEYRLRRHGSRMLYTNRCRTHEDEI
jgi:hypothetical protein